MAKIVLFVDALDYRDMSDGFHDTMRGYVESGKPKVTPKVTSEVYTGETPSVNGMGRVHSMKGPSPHRPEMPLIQEKLEAAGYNVLSLHMPYCLPLQLRNGAWISTAMQEEQMGQNPIARMCKQPPAGGNMSDSDADWDAIYNSKVEDMYAKSSSMLNAQHIADFDVVFMAIRTPDEYTHFQWGEGYREQLIENLGREIGRWQVNHDVLWWSDHGSEEKKETFRVNKWLMEKGYLDIEIDLEFNKRFQDEMEQMTPRQNQAGPDIPNQISPHSPGVEIKESTQAISMDPYDSSIDIMDDELDPQELIDEMMGTGMYEDVATAEDEWGQGQFLDQSPDIVALRADNVLVTGNVHPEPIGMGFMRTGVHSKKGVWGTTDSEFEVQKDVRPTELHDVIWEFVTGSSQVKQEAQQRISQISQQMEQAQKWQEHMQKIAQD